MTGQYFLLPFLKFWAWGFFPAYGWLMIWHRDGCLRLTISKGFLPVEELVWQIKKIGPHLVLHPICFYMPKRSVANILPTNNWIIRSIHQSGDVTRWDIRSCLQELELIRPKCLDKYVWRIVGQPIRLNISWAWVWTRHISRISRWWPDFMFANLWVCDEG